MIKHYSIKEFIVDGMNNPPLESMCGVLHVPGDARHNDMHDYLWHPSVYVERAHGEVNCPECILLYFQEQAEAEDE